MIMRLSELIKNLQEKLKAHGDVKCFTNGEHGCGDSEEMRLDTVSLSTADNELDEGTVSRYVRQGLLNDENELVLNIGGF
jgi:hypothetical protein